MGTENATVTVHVVTNGHPNPLDSGHARLRELGYKQELKRDLSVLSNFAFSFSIISVLTGVTTLYNTGLNYGGTVSFVYGWFVASAFTMIVALSMAEICSSYPTSGGLYYWSAKLAGPTWAPFASWITGWFNIVGQWAVTTSVDFSLAQLFRQRRPRMLIEMDQKELSALGISIIVGWGYILGITFAVTDIPYLLSENNDSGGYAIAEIFYLAFKKRYGTGLGDGLCFLKRWGHAIVIIVA
ncbi:Amino acid/polyamine transporter I [Sesbania bispinosa]|nr:Amino acid/polyamine transporter I [Sesbania bispinosa]